MNIILETNNYCEGITSFNGNLYIKLDGGVYLFKENELIESNDQVLFIDNNLPLDYYYDDGYLHIKDKVIEIGSPFHYLTLHKNYIYAHFGIDGLCLSKIKII